MAAAAVARTPSRRTGRRIALVAVGAIVSVLLVGAGAFALLALAAQHSFRTSFGYAGVRSLVVQNDAGDMSLSSAPTGRRLMVTEDQTEGLFKPSLQSRLARDGTLTLRATCPGQPECSVHYTLSVPPGVAVKVKSTVGDVTADDLVDNPSVELSTGGGNVTASGLSAPTVHLSTGVGNLNARLTKAARSLDASSGAGDITLTVPNVSYAVHASSGLGHVSDPTVPNDPASPRSIDAHSSLGNVTITVTP